MRARPATCLDAESFDTAARDIMVRGKADHLGQPALRQPASPPDYHVPILTTVLDIQTPIWTLRWPQDTSTANPHAPMTIAIL